MTRRVRLSIIALALVFACVALLSQTSVIGPVPTVVTKLNLYTQAANIGATVMYVIPAGSPGTYRFNCYAVLTQVATSSSTLPTCNVWWYDADTGVGVGPVPVNATMSGNTLGTTSGGGSVSNSFVFQGQPSTNVFYSTAGYASSGATPMQYALHAKLEYLGQ